VIISLLVSIVLFFPNALGEPDNFIAADPLVTPPHIVPEWYFLFAYAILRSIPNKLGGVLGLFRAILVLATLPLLHANKMKGIGFYPPAKMFYWLFVVSFVLLTLGGAWPVEEPYVNVSQHFSAMYFAYFALAPCFRAGWDSVLD